MVPCEARVRLQASGRSLQEEGIGLGAVGWIKIASAYPRSPVYQNARGVNKTDWIPLDRSLYNACLDPVEYRPKP